MRRSTRRPPGSSSSKQRRRTGRAPSAGTGRVRPVGVPGGRADQGAERVDDEVSVGPHGLIPAFTWTDAGAGACVRVSHTVPQGHNVSLLDVMAIEMRDAPAAVDVC